MTAEFRTKELFAALTEVAPVLADAHPMQRSVELKLIPGGLGEAGFLGAIHVRAQGNRCGITLAVRAAVTREYQVTANFARLRCVLEACDKAGRGRFGEKTTMELRTRKLFSTLCLRTEEGMRAELPCETEGIASWPSTVPVAKGELDHSFGSAVRQWMTHASADPMRSNLHGLCFEPEGERLHLVTTDGHRMAFRTMESSFPKTEPVILHADLAKVIPIDIPIELALGDTKALIRPVGLQSSHFVAAWCEIVSGVTVPPWRMLIPCQPRVVKVEAVRFASTVQALSVLRVGKARPLVTLSWSKKGHLRITRASNDDGIKGSRVVRVFGDPLQTEPVHVNAEYLAAACDLLRSEPRNVYEIGWSGRFDPVVLGDTEGRRVVVMPCRLDEELR